MASQESLSEHFKGVNDLVHHGLAFVGVSEMWIGPAHEDESQGKFVPHYLWRLPFNCRGIVLRTESEGLRGGYGFIQTAYKSYQALGYPTTVPSEPNEHNVAQFITHPFSADVILTQFEDHLPCCVVQFIPAWKKPPAQKNTCQLPLGNSGFLHETWASIGAEWRGMYLLAEFFDVAASCGVTYTGHIPGLRGAPSHHVYDLPEGVLTGPQVRQDFLHDSTWEDLQQKYYVAPDQASFVHYERRAGDNLLFQLWDTSGPAVKGQDHFQFIPHTHQKTGGIRKFAVAPKSLPHFEPKNRQGRVAAMSRQWLEEDGLE